MYGWMGKILRVDLTTETIHYEYLDKDLYHKFIGGRGINSKILYDEIEMDSSPFAPENVLILGQVPCQAPQPLPHRAARSPQNHHLLTSSVMPTLVDSLHHT